MPQRPEYLGNNYRKLAELNAWTNQRYEAPLEPDLPIIDPHHHLWDDEYRGRYLIDDLMEDIGSGHNVIATVYVETGAQYRTDGPPAMRPVGEVEFVNRVSGTSASRNNSKPVLCAGIVGYADLTLGDKVRPVLEALIAEGGERFRGVRYSVPWDMGNATKSYRRQVPRYQLLDPVFRKGFAHLQPLGLSFDAWQFYPQLPDLIDLLRTFPETNMILNHTGGLLGIPPHDRDRNQVFTVWHAHIRELAQFPNLSIKLGGLGMLNVGWDFHLRDVPPSSEDLATAWRPYIESCIEAFGTSRCMMESNFPVDKQSSGYGVLWNALKRITRGCSAAEKAALYHGNASRVYRLSV